MAAAEVSALPDIPVDDDDEDADDLKFSTTYRETEQDMVLSAKEADFRAFLCDSGATNEIVRLLVGLGEAEERPADPVAFLRAKFDSQDLPDMVQGKMRDDIPALLELNRTLHEQSSTLQQDLDTTLATISEAEAVSAAPLLQGLIDAYASDTLDGALDVAKLYAAVSARFPPPPEPPAEGEEPTEPTEPPPPQPWAVDGAPSPAGTASAEALSAWAKAAFGYGSALVAEHGPELTVALLAAAGAPPEEPCELNDAKASALLASLVILEEYTEERKPPPPEEEAAQ